MNKKGEKPESLIDSNESDHTPKTIDLVEQESLTRFDKRKGSSNNRKKKKRANNNPSETNIATKEQKTPNEPHNKEQENKQQTPKPQGAPRYKGNRNKSKTEQEQVNKA